MSAESTLKSVRREAVQEVGGSIRRVLAQGRACCPGLLPRGLVRVPATRAPPSAAPAPRAIELAVHAGCLPLDYESFEGVWLVVFLLYLNVPVTVLFFLCSV